jgi:hypothetical protein
MPFFKLSFVMPKRQYSSENLSLLLRSYDKITKGNMCDLTLRSGQPGGAFYLFP